MFQIIKSMASRYAEELKRRVERRTVEMEQDDTSHYLLYRVLGVMEEEGRLIDLYQKQRAFSVQIRRFFLGGSRCCLHQTPVSPSHKGQNSKSFRRPS